MQQALHHLLTFEDPQVVEAMVWGLDSEQRLRFLRLVEDAFGMTQAEPPSASDDSEPEENEYTFVMSLDPRPLAEPQPVDKAAPAAAYGSHKPVRAGAHRAVYESGGTGASESAGQAKGRHA